MTRHDLLTAALAIIVSACGVVGSDYVPTDETFRKRIGPFISERGVDVEPIYGNIDVDSVFGKYVVNADASNEIVAEITERATRSGWTLQQRQATEYEFHKRTNAVRPSYEIVRVIYRGQQPVIVYVAWLQTDGVTTPTEARESVEGKWAGREFWPRFEREVASR
jgi:hypothetical protein